MIGPDKPIDTNKYFYRSNVLGGCVGTTGLMILILIPQKYMV